jgi:hypothetical protein
VKTYAYSSLLMLLAMLALPLTADAFSRRSDHAEVAQNQQAGPSNNHNNSHSNNDTHSNNNTSHHTPLNTTSVSAQAVPEPPLLLLMSLAIGILALFSIANRLGRSNTSS